MRRGCGIELEPGGGIGSGVAGGRADDRKPEAVEDAANGEVGGCLVAEEGTGNYWSVGSLELVRVVGVFQERLRGGCRIAGRAFVVCAEPHWLGDVAERLVQGGKDAVRRVVAVEDDDGLPAGGVRGVFRVLCEVEEVLVMG